MCHINICQIHSDYEYFGQWSIEPKKYKNLKKRKTNNIQITTIKKLFVDRFNYIVMNIFAIHEVRCSGRKNVNICFNYNIPVQCILSIYVGIRTTNLYVRSVWKQNNMYINYNLGWDLNVMPYFFFFACLNVGP